MKVAIWTNMPNHYQAPFHQALREGGVDLRVCYYDQVPADRVAMGWGNKSSLPDGEAFVSPSIESLHTLADWQQRIHVVPGCSGRFLRQLSSRLCHHRCDWVHWSEPSHPGWRRIATYPLKRSYARRINRFALGALANGELARRDFCGWGVLPEKIELLSYSTPSFNNGDQADAECLAFRKDKLAFCFVGRMCHRKGIDVLLRAFAVLDSEDAVLLMIGPKDDCYAQMARSLKIDGRILFRGRMPPAQVGTAIKACDILVLPSRFDGWGLTLNEGAAGGKALIATDQCGAGYHLIDHEKNGYRVRPGDVRSLRDAMQRYVDEPELAARHGEVSVALAREFGPERNASRFIEAITEWRRREG